MLAFILRRLAQAVVVMVSVALIAFMLFQYVGDPVVFLLGQDATPEQIYLEGFNKALLLASQNVRITVTDEFTKKVTETFGPDQQWDFTDEVYQIDVDSILQTGSEIVEPDQPTQ